MRISYLTDEALAILRGQLPANLECYASGDLGFFSDILDDIDGIKLYSELDFPDFELDMTSDFSISDPYNVRTLYTAMRNLPPSIACDERLWAGLAHGLFWDYVQYRQKEQIATGEERKIATSFFFTNGRKRSLYVNCLSRLWWAGYLTYDESNDEDPFALTDLIAKRAFPSTITLFSSSNMTANRQIGLGVLDSIMKRGQSGEEIKRKHFVGSLRYLNNMGGITLLDVLSRSEITAIVDAYFDTDEFAKLKLGAKTKAPAAEDDEDIDDEIAVVEAQDNPVETKPVETRAAYDPLIDDLEYYDYEYIDQRAQGGPLWIIGGDELEGFIEEWRDRLVEFAYSSRGSSITHWKPGWWTMDKSPE